MSTPNYLTSAIVEVKSIDQPRRGMARDETPGELSTLFMVARAQGCQWLMLDSDGPEIEGLATFDW